MKKSVFALVLLLALLTLSACGEITISLSDEDQVATSVAATLHAQATSQPQPVCTAPACGPGQSLGCPSGDCPGGCGTVCVDAAPLPACSPPACGPGQTLGCPGGQCPGGCGSVCVDVASANSSVSGNVCYPSEGIPPMTVYIQETTTNAVVEVAIAQNQSTYEADVPPGTYMAYAWLPDFSIGGGYTHAVPCGLSVNCTDHSPLQFLVVDGQTATGIDVCDWYGGPFDIPLPPGVDAAETTGSISGSLNYPSEGIPSLTVVAFNINTGFWYYVITASGTGFYTISDLPPGSYRVVAYAGGSLAGGYSQAVPCGLTFSCTDHSLITVTVTAGNTTENVNPWDWYAPDGTFPANPVP